jgi:hypothetical protein
MAKHSLIAIMLLSLTPVLGAEWNVRDFGATGDGRTDDTTAIQRALDTCSGTGGVVTIPMGTFLSKPLTIGTKTTLYLDQGAVLQATTRQIDWMITPMDWLSVKENSNYKPFLSGENLQDVSILGSGTIDGGGSAWWAEAEKARRSKPARSLPRPKLIVIKNCRNLRVEGITIRNSPMFHLVPTDCEGVTISAVTILAPQGAANTDAIDPTRSRDVHISKCLIDVGDDNVAIKSSGKVPGRGYACEDITVTDCTFLHGHGVSIGSETAGGVRRVVVRNCSFENTVDALRIKSARGRGGIVEDVTYDGITMKNVASAISISCFYGDKHAEKGGESTAIAAAADDAKAREKIPTFRNIRISNVTATCTKSPGKIVGLPESKVSNVILENIQISAPGKFLISNATDIRLRNVAVKVPEGAPFLITNAEVTGLPQQTSRSK